MGAAPRGQDSGGPDRLRPYRDRRRFDRTGEPAGAEPGGGAGGGEPRFVVQIHDASTLHFDFRLEAEGVLKSWSVPKGPSADPREKRLAMPTEDHPMEYREFEGTIPAGDYGAGTVIVWDEGTYRPLTRDRRGRPVPFADALRKGHASFWLNGGKLRGGYALTRFRGGDGEREAWLLVKEDDARATRRGAPDLARARSALTGRTLRQVAADENSATWHSGRGRGGSRRSSRRSGRGGTGGDRGSEDGAGTGAARAAGAAEDLPDLPEREARLLRPAPPGTRLAARPMLAALTDRRDFGAGWIFERKLDGVRILAVREDGRTRLITRNGLDAAVTYPEIADALGEQAGDDFTLDGEIVAFSHGRTDFSRLQQRMQLSDPDRARASGVAVTYYVFDLLRLGGIELTRLPLRTRKSLLRRAIDFAPPLRFTEHRNEGGQGLLDDACSRGWEGLIAKRADGRYQHRRSRDWLKLKCAYGQEFVIGAWTEPSGSRADLGALLLGYHRGGRLRYAGKVGTGFPRAVLHDLRRRLDTRAAPRSPFADPVREPTAHWVRPELVAQVGFTEWTPDGMLRHPRYQGLRDDKDPRDVVRESPADGGDGDRG